MMKFSLSALAVALSSVPSAMAQEAPIIAIVAPNSASAVSADAAIKRYKFNSVKLTDLDSLVNDPTDRRPLIVIGMPERMPSRESLDKDLAVLGGLSKPVTYMLFAQTAAKRDPFKGIKVPDNVKVVVGIKAFDQALVAQSHTAAKTGYDGAGFYYDVGAAIDLASAQLGWASGKPKKHDNLKLWTSGVNYVFYDSEIVRSGAPQDALIGIRNHAASLGKLEESWYSIDAGAFSKSLPRALVNDMHGVYRSQVGSVCGEAYPWDGHSPARLYESLKLD